MLDLRLRSMFGSVDWEAEAYVASQGKDWPRFLYCLKRRPELVAAKSPARVAPWWQALKSGNWEVMEAVALLGADIDASESSIFGMDLSDAALRNLQQRTRVPLFPGYYYPRVSALTLSWMLGLKSIHAKLLERTKPATHYDAILWALLLNDEKWLAQFSLADTFAKHVIGEHHTGFTPATAALFGGASARIFGKVWAAMPQPLRELTQIVSTAPPGHEEGDHPIHSGDAAFWADYLNRDDLLRIIRGEARRTL